MIAADKVLDNPYVTIQNEEIGICYRKKTYRLALDKISKMYLSKKKPNYWTSLPGMKFFHDDTYDLCIETRDHQDITIGVKAFEKHFFIDPIAVVRRLKKSNPQ